MSVAYLPDVFEVERSGFRVPVCFPVGVFNDALADAVPFFLVVDVQWALLLDAYKFYRVRGHDVHGPIIAGWRSW